MDIITEEFFEDFVSHDLVLLHFWETWCIFACDQVHIAHLDQFEKDTNIKVGRINLSENCNLGIKLQIKILPAYIFFKEGKPVKSLFGVQTTQYLKDAIKSLTR